MSTIEAAITIEPTLKVFPRAIIKLSIAEQFCAVFGTESQRNAGYWGQKRGKNKVNNRENVGFILHPV